MTTQPEEAVGSEAPVPAADASDPFLDIANEMLGEDPVEPEAEEPEAEIEDEPEIEAEEVDELPPIDAPVSWDGDAKEAFKSLPRELQETVTKREAERERFVQQKSQEAARSRSEAQQAAISELAGIQEHYAQQFEQVAQQLQVPPPDYSLLATNPGVFAAQAERYQQAQAQQQQLQQHAAKLAQEAQAAHAQAEQAYHAEQRQRLVEHYPEYLDPTNGPKLQQELSAVARELGYSPELIAQARADDILAMKTAADWKAKAAKYDALQANKMAKVRAAKGLPKVATPGVAVGADAQRQSRAAAALEVAKSSHNRDQQGAAFFDYLKNTGQI